MGGGNHLGKCRLGSKQIHRLTEAGLSERLVEIQIKLYFNYLDTQNFNYLDTQNWLQISHHLQNLAAGNGLTRQLLIELVYDNGTRVMVLKNHPVFFINACICVDFIDIYQNETWVLCDDMTLKCRHCTGVLKICNIENSCFQVQLCRTDRWHLFVSFPSHVGPQRLWLMIQWHFG